MSQHKFACPVCGQHLTAGPADSGQEITCPTCFQKLVVPAPRAGDSKLIVSALLAERRKAPLPAVSGSPAVKRSASRISLSVVFLLLLLGGIIYAIYFKTSHGAHPAPPTSSNTAALSQPPVPLANLPWSLDVATARFTNGPVAGRVRGHPFQTESATLQGGTLTLRQGRVRKPELAVALYLSATRGEDLAGKTIVVRSDRQRAPQIQLRWKDEKQKNQAEKIRGGYALKIAFDQPVHGRLTGRIWLSTPDQKQSFVAGEFDAEIRKPQPKKPAPSK